MKRWLVFALVLGGFVFLLLRPPSQPPAPVKAPEIVLPDLNGQVVRLSQLRGKVVLVNIWATWCAPCRKEMPSMEALYQTLKDEDFVILAVSQDVDGRKVVAPYVEDGGFTFPVLLDEQGEVSRKYGVGGLPETFIIDRQGMIVHRHIGYQDWSQPAVEASVRRLLDQGVWVAKDQGQVPQNRG